MARHNKRKNWKDFKKTPAQEGASSPPAKKVRNEDGSYPSNKGWTLSNIGKNQMWNEYYQKIGVIPEGEFEQFKQSLCEDLPITFRVVRSSPYAELIQDLLVNHWTKSLQDIEIDGVKVNPPRQLKWYPGGFGWEFNVSRNQLKKSAVLKKFHQFIHILTETGYLCRQEAVSMLPTHFLDVQPHHAVLDMCASPGSKTSQMIECVHGQKSYGKIPEGIVVANDVEQARCYTLVHQILGRLASPATLVTNHFAQFFPYGEDKNNNADRAVYDRILCDVPCTSDGTLRKNPDLWDKWSPSLGLGIHKLQLDITMKGLHLTKEGGIVIYSTCSLNPVEDEAVVAEILRKSDGAVVLEDARSVLPELKYAQGKNWWKLLDRDGTWYNSHESMPENRQKRVAPSVFPPYSELPPKCKTRDVTKISTDAEGNEVSVVVQEDIIDEEYEKELAEYVRKQEELVREKYHLERCMRILPHLQNTSGFFVAVLRKLRHFSPLKNRESFEGIYAYRKSDFAKPAAAAEESKDADVKVDDVPAEKAEATEGEGAVAVEGEEKPKFVRRTPRGTRGGTKEAPFLKLGESWTKVLQSLKDFWGFTDDFPYDNLIVRSEASPNIYLVSPGSQEYIEAYRNNTLKLVNTGVKVFSKKSFDTPNCEFRVGLDGLAFILPYITKRKVPVSYADFGLLLSDADIRFDQFSPATGALFSSLEIGSVIALVKRPTWPKSFPAKEGATEIAEKPTSEIPESELIAIPVWRGRNSIRLFSGKTELAALKLLYLGETPADEVMTAQKTEAPAPAPAPAEVAAEEDKATE